MNRVAGRCNEQEFDGRSAFPGNRAARAVSMDAPIRNQKDGAETLHDTLPDAGELRGSNGREIELIVADALAALDERSRFIITESTIYGVTIEETGGACSGYRLGR